LKPCPRCGGLGFVFGEKKSVKCKECKGDGRIWIGDKSGRRQAATMRAEAAENKRVDFRAAIEDI
jgi:DnaJ-class molecular chaperone